MLIVIDQPATAAEAFGTTRGTDGLGLVVDAGGSDARGDARPGRTGGGLGPVMAGGNESSAGATQAGTVESAEGKAAAVRVRSCL